MESEYRLRTLLDEVDKEFLGLNHFHRAKIALEQISVWQQRFNEAKGKILRENIVDTTPSARAIGQYQEIEA